MIFKVLYNPDNLPKSMRKYLKDSFSYSMVSREEDSCQYDVSLLHEHFNKETNTEEENNFLKYLEEESINYIEI